MGRLMRKTTAVSEARNSGTFWFIAKEKLLTGPYTYEQVLAELAAGKLDPGDYAWRQGFQEWRPLCSVEDFGFQVKPYVVRSYPLVPVPSAKASSDEAGAKSSKTAISNKIQAGGSGPGAKTVKVRLETQRRLQVGLWERVAMVIFAVCFAWAATWVALSEVQESFESLYERHLAGGHLVIGDVWQASVIEDVAEVSEEVASRDPASLGRPEGQTRFWTFEQLAPVLAAPGLEAFETEAWPVSAVIQRPLVSPFQSPVAQSEWSLPSGHSIDWSDAVSGEARFQHAADPIYVQPYQVLGTWSAAQPKALHVRTLGYPGP